MLWNRVAREASLSQESADSGKQRGFSSSSDRDPRKKLAASSQNQAAAAKEAATRNAVPGSTPEAETTRNKPQKGLGNLAGKVISQHKSRLGPSAQGGQAAAGSTEYSAIIRDIGLPTDVRLGNNDTSAAQDLPQKLATQRSGPQEGSQKEAKPNFPSLNSNGTIPERQSGGDIGSDGHRSR